MRQSHKVTGILLVFGSCVSLQFGAALAMSLFPLVGPWTTVDNHATPIVSIRFTSDLGDAPSSTPVVTITMSKCGILWLVVGNNERVFLCRNQPYPSGYGCDD